VGISGLSHTRSSSPLPPKPLSLSLSPEPSSLLEFLGEADAFVRKGGGGGGVGQGGGGRRGGGGDGEGGGQGKSRGEGDGAGKGGGRRAGRKIESAIGTAEANVNVGADGGEQIMGGRDGGGGYIHNRLMTVEIIAISDSAGMPAGGKGPEVEGEGERGETEKEHESVQTRSSVDSPRLSSGEKVCMRAYVAVSERQTQLVISGAFFFVFPM